MVLLLSGPYIWRQKSFYYFYQCCNIYKFESLNQESYAVKTHQLESIGKNTRFIKIASKKEENKYALKRGFRIQANQHSLQINISIKSAKKHRGTDNFNNPSERSALSYTGRAVITENLKQKHSRINTLRRRFRRVNSAEPITKKSDH